MDPFVAGVAETTERYGLIPEGAGVVVGVSGGPDSTALLAALVELAPRRRHRLVVAHLDHGLRGAEAREDACFVAGLAARWGLPFEEDRLDVAALARRLGTSVEAAGRTARYRFLRATAARHGCRLIAVGHHRDDQVETVLLNLLSGAGSDGLAGMPPRQGPVIRPLYERTRAEVLAFLDRAGLAFRRDAANLDAAFARNRVRHELLPLLRRRYNPRIDDALWRMSRLLADEARYLEAEAERLLARCRLDLPGGLWLDASALQEAHPVLRRRALRLAFWSAAPAREGFGPRLSAGHVQALERLLGAPAAAVDLPGAVRAEVRQGRLVFRTGAGGEPAPAPPPKTLPVPGAVPWLAPWATLAAEVLDAQQVRGRDLGQPGHAYLDYDALGRPAALTVRTRRPGDRLRPLGAPGRRKLQDLLVDRKVPRTLRDVLPLVTAGAEILWVPGVAVNDAYRVGDGTRSVLHLHTAPRNPEVLR